MEMMTQNIDLKNLDKSTWITYRFDQLAQKVSETVDPKTTDLEIYVGLEHLDRESIHLKRKGVPSDVSGGKLKCYPGDVIFGKRRAYQRKAAIVDFEGICSAHAFVLRAIPEVMNPMLFPFFLHSDLFMHCAVDISVGGLSPTINWGQLKEQEFLLPPKDQQAQLAKLLWAMDEVIENEKEVLEKLKLSYQVEIEKSVPRNTQEYWILGDVIKTRKGVTYKSSDYSDKENGLPLLNLKSIERGGGFNTEGIKYYKGVCKESHFAKNDDLIIACTDITREGKVVGFPLHPSVYQNKRMLFTMDLVAIEISDSNLLRDYLYYVLKAGWVHWILFAYSPGTTVLHLDLTGMKKIKFPKYSIEEQRTIVIKLRSFEESITNVETKIGSSSALQKSLINQVF
jgi:type I restriction enzyme S subunit